MSCNNCNDFPISCAPKAPGGDCCPKPQPPKPCPPPVIRPGTSQYIGARYVPMFADPVKWDKERAYEPLTIVVHNGDCYTSKCFVPVGADISNSLYWVKSQDYNYQFDQLKQVVADLSKQVTAFAGDNEKFTELINNFSTEFATMQTEFNKWAVQFPAMTERIDAVEADIDALQAAAAETAKTIDGLKKTDSELARRLDGHDTDIAGLRAKDIEQDGRLDALDAKNAQYDADIAALKAKDADQQTQLDSIKTKNTEQDTRLDGIDTKLEQNTADIAKNTENIQDNAENIAVNARELADHAEQLKNHDARLTAQQKEIADNTSGIAGLRADLTEDEAKIEANRDAIAHINDSLTGYVKTEVYTAGQAAQDTKITAAQAAADTANTNIGNWETDHPGQTISECATSIENEIAAVDAKADANAANIGDWNTQHPGKTIAAKDTDQDGRLDALESAHHYANIEQALKQKGYLDVKESTAPFTFEPGTASAAARATFSTDVELRVQLPYDTVIDDFNTVPPGNVTVCPGFAFLGEDDRYKRASTTVAWPIKHAKYYPGIQTIALTLTPVKQPYTFFAKTGTSPLFWEFTAYYL